MQEDIMPAKLIVNKGDRFQKDSRLTVIKELKSIIYVHNEKRHKIRRFLCECDCSNTSIVHLRDLKDGSTKSCGCLQKEVVTKRNTTHGLSNHKIASHFYSMHDRCDNDPYYKDRNVCDRWSGKKGIVYFIKDMYPTWFKGGELERKDNDDGYSPSNCIWTTHKKQMQNTSKSIPVEINGRKYCLKEAVRIYGGVSYRLARWRIQKLGWNTIQAILSPEGKKLTKKQIKIKLRKLKNRKT